jgi:hypothetical protein
MRRSLAVLALILTTWPHIAVMSCAGPAPSPGSYASWMVQEHDHGEAECPALMVCTAAMIESVGVADPTEAPGPEVRLVAPRALPPIATVLTDEPPPPRRSA